MLPHIQTTLPKFQAVVVRASEMPENKVVVINGGGSGH